MGLFIFIMVIILAVWGAFRFANHRISKREESYIKCYEFPDQLTEFLVANNGENEAREILRRLRSYFLLLHQSSKIKSEVPSEDCDLALRRFILLTREYREFCAKAFGRYIDYRPASRGIKSRVMLNGPLLGDESYTEGAGTSAVFAGSDCGGGDAGGGGDGGGC